MKRRRRFGFKQEKRSACTSRFWMSSLGPWPRVPLAAVLCPNVSTGSGPTFCWSAVSLTPPAGLFDEPPPVDYFLICLVSVLLVVVVQRSENDNQHPYLGLTIRIKTHHLPTRFSASTFQTRDDRRPPPEIFALNAAMIHTTDFRSKRCNINLFLYLLTSSSARLLTFIRHKI